MNAWVLRMSWPCVIAIVSGACGGDESGAHGGAGVGGAGATGVATVTPACNASASGASDQDDMAFWIHPSDTSQSVLVSSDKAATRLFVYDLGCNVVQTLTPPGKPGNLDVRYGFPLGGGDVDIVAWNDRSSNKIRVARIDADTRTLTLVDDDAIATLTPNYGLALYRSESGKTFAFVSQEGGAGMAQYELTDDGSGKVHGTEVRSWTSETSSQVEGQVCDDEHAVCFYADETGGIWKIGAEPSDATPGTLIAAVGHDGLAADVEGITVYRRTDGGGYLIASSQGSDTFVVYDRVAPHALAGAFHVSGATTTDGIDVTNVDLGGAFAEGAFVAHGGVAQASNFMVPWRDIATPLGLAIDTSYSPRP